MRRLVDCLGDQLVVELDVADGLGDAAGEDLVGVSGAASRTSSAASSPAHRLDRRFGAGFSALLGSGKLILDRLRLRDGSSDAEDELAVVRDQRPLAVVATPS
jgi:hypothetical protein